MLYSRCFASLELHWSRRIAQTISYENPVPKKELKDKFLCHKW